MIYLGVKMSQNYYFWICRDTPESSHVYLILKCFGNNYSGMAFLSMSNCGVGIWLMFCLIKVDVKDVNALHFIKSHQIFLHTHIPTKYSGLSITRIVTGSQK